MAGEAIFIGYRRDDTADVAGRIYDAMALRFSKGRIFKDVDNIGPGIDFGDYIKSVLPRCRVALVLIGPHWLDSKDETGQRRIDDNHDWVRIEIETALATPDLLVVPVLVNGARMPRGEEVPESLRPLLRRNAAIIRRDPDFHDDVERLAAALRASVSTGILDLTKISGKVSAPEPRARNKSAPLIIGGAIAAALAVAALFVWQPWRGFPPPPAGEVDRAQRETEGGAISSPLSQPAAQPDSSPVNLGANRASDGLQSASTPAPQAEQSIPLPEMVRIPGQNFEVGRYEVTFAQWDACVAAGACNGDRPSDAGWGRGSRPLINVSWDDAQAYVRWLINSTGQRYRLLTSAEWEIAARAGTTTNFSWGDQDPVCDQNARNGANFGACTDDRTRPVGSFQPNAFGLYDVHGNVWERVEDCDFTSCSSRVLRGGSWYDGSEFLRSANRGWGTAANRIDSIGFRVARTL